MNSRFIRLPGFIYLLILIADVFSLATPTAIFHQWLKPALMPALMAFLWMNVAWAEKRFWILILFGLILAWAGDVFLLLESKYSFFFLAGLGSFLGTHICYIFFFRKFLRTNPGWWKQNWWIILTILAYGILLVTGLWPDLGSLKIPVMIYAACITIMVLLCFRIHVDLAGRIWVWMAIGAYLFLISDSILAINKFHGAGDFAPSFVMLTYGLAQFFIVLGTIRFCQAIHDEDEAPAV